MATPRLRSKKLSEPTIARLPVYQRIAEGLLRRGEGKIDSKQIGELAGVTATTVRRDLAGLGSFGTRGAGYDTAILIERIADALGHDRLYDVIVVGIGNLGRALVNSSNFLIRGARLVALYDNDLEVIGHEVAGLVVQPLSDPMPAATVGVICTPGSAAQDVADRMVEADIRLERPCTTWTSRLNCRSSCTTSITARGPWVEVCCTLSASPALTPCGARNMSVTEEAMWH
jgi:redox-sensing transcriptional repressor